MPGIAFYQEYIEKAIKDTFKTKNPVELYDPINYVLSNGGKRLRPVLVLVACDMFGGNIDNAINAALGIEIFHNFTLLHDDIMDHASIRRNRPTVHEKWDENRAILSGDVMSILASEYISRSEPSIIPTILQIFNKTAIEVCEGQQYDMNFESAANVTMEEYLEMIRLKTAVLLAGSLKIGALLGGASMEEASKIYDFGINLGLAFQLQDDLLDTFGNENTFGKKIGGDIRENKKTFLFIKAFELAENENLKLLNQYFTDEKFTGNEKVDKVIHIFNDLNIKKLTENQIQFYIEKASKILENIGVENEKKTDLKTLILNLSGRSN